MRWRKHRAVLAVRRCASGRSSTPTRIFRTQVANALFASRAHPLQLYHRQTTIKSTISVSEASHAAVPAPPVCAYHIDTRRHFDEGQEAKAGDIPGRYALPGMPRQGKCRAILLVTTFLLLAPHSLPCKRARECPIENHRGCALARFARAGSLILE